MTEANGRVRLLIAAVTLAIVVTVPLAIADSPATDAEAKAAGLAKKVRKLQKQVRALQKQVAGISQGGGAAGATGPQGPQGVQGAPGAQGPQGPAGSDAQFAGAAAGGDLTGTYPNPAIAANAVGTAEVADQSLTSTDVDQNTLFNDNSLNSTDLGNNAVLKAELGANSVGSSEIGDSIVDRFDETPTLILGGTAQNGAYNTDQSIASCVAGEEIIGAYGTWTDIAGADEELFIQRVGIDHGLENVIVVGGNDSGLDRHLAAVATCWQP